MLHGVLAGRASVERRSREGPRSAAEAAYTSVLARRLGCALQELESKNPELTALILQRLSELDDTGLRRVPRAGNVEPTALGRSWPLRHSPPEPIPAGRRER